MSRQQIQRFTCDHKGCSKYRDQVELSPGIGRERLTRIGWLRKQERGQWRDYCVEHAPLYDDEDKKDNTP